MKMLLFLYLSIIILHFGCTKPADSSADQEVITQGQTITDTEPESATPPIHPIGDNSQTSLDWPGTYFATLPCASCEGIETWVTLNQDGTFVLKTHHMGLNDDRDEIFTGKFTWDETGSMVTLNGLIGGAPGKYKVGENRIWHLDQDGNRIEGDLADRYILTKK